MARRARRLPKSRAGADAMPEIPFCVPFTASNEAAYVTEALRAGVPSVKGQFSGRSRAILEHMTGGRAFLTTSGSAALELATLVAGIGPGDEVILPSYTFSSVANAVVLRGAIPVFVDVERATLNIDPDRIEAAIGPRTKAIMVVHYAGVICNMARISAIARRNGLLVIEDAAHAIGSTREGQSAGSFGDLATFSFHYTKNVTCGEGGALVVNSPELVGRTEIAFEKGTNRGAYLKGQTDKYTWMDVGSSFTMSELNAAMLCAQLEALPQITTARLKIWARYATACSSEGFEVASPPTGHNAHLFYLVLDDERQQDRFIGEMKMRAISAQFHYVPLHSSPAGRRLGRAAGPTAVTDSIWSRMVRLPLYPSLQDDEVNRIVAVVSDLAAQLHPAVV